MYYMTNGALYVFTYLLYHDSHSDIQLWARAAHCYGSAYIGRLSIMPSVKR